MNGAEFRCKREFLGLSAAWFARNLGVETRTVQRWEGQKEIPHRAAQAVEQLCAGAARAVSMIAVDQLKQKRTDGSLPPLVIPADDGGQLPASWHRMIAVRVAERTGQNIAAA